MLDIEVIKILTLALAIVAGIRFIKRGDEFPALIVGFFYLTGISRYDAVLDGKSRWCEVNYAVNFFSMTDQIAIEALNYMFLGTAVFAVSYMIISYKRPKVKTIDNDKSFQNFLQSKKIYILILFGFFIIINTITRNILSNHQGGFAEGMSYFFLFKMAIGGLIMLFFLLFKNLNKKKRVSRFIFLVLLVWAAYSSYNPTARFNFLSWMVALTYIIVGKKNPVKKGIVYAVGGTIVLFLFLIAGNARFAFMEGASLEKQLAMAQYRMDKAEDQNMLDGFMMVLQVYPDKLDFGYGAEHLEILTRPIPRAIWPGKPVGGYANKLGLNNNMGGYTVGISQSIYGSFYGEGGVLGIILFSILYAWAFSKLFNTTLKYASDMRLMIYGIILTSAIPLFRGGDLPGIYAFIGMSYWPVFIFIYMYKKYLKKEKCAIANKARITDIETKKIHNSQIETDL